MFSVIPDLLGLVRVVSGGIFLCGIEREEHCNILVVQQIVLPSVPFARGGFEDVRKILCGVMVVCLHRQRFGRGVPGIVFIIPARDEILLIPSPITFTFFLAVDHGKRAGVEAEPCPAVFHKITESLLLLGRIRSVVQENDHIILRKCFIVQQVVIIARKVIGKPEFFSLCGEPLVGFPREIGVRGVAALGEAESKGFEAVSTAGARRARVRSALFFIASFDRADPPVFGGTALPFSSDMGMRFTGRNANGGGGQPGQCESGHGQRTNCFFHNVSSP